MRKKYNLALVPAENREKFLQYANTISFLAKPDSYRIGNQSMPHVTLCHFEAEENTLDAIWQEVSNLDQLSIDLTFNVRRSKIYDHPTYGGICWVSLIPDQLDRLKEMHLAVAEIIKNPTNLSFDEYDPHLTLLNSHNKIQCNEINKDPQVKPSLQERFVVALGASDDVGQLIKIIHHYVPKTANCLTGCTIM